MSRIAITLICQTRSGISEETAAEGAAAAGLFPTAACCFAFFLPDLVEAVFANLFYLLEARKELFVRRSHALLWSNHSLIDAVIVE